MNEDEYFNFRAFDLRSVNSYEEGLRTLAKMDNALVGLEHKLIRAQSGRSPNSPEWRQRVEFTIKKARITRQQLYDHLPNLKRTDTESKFIKAAKELLPENIYAAILARAGEI